MTDRKLARLRLARAERVLAILDGKAAAHRGARLAKLKAEAAAWAKAPDAPKSDDTGEPCANTLELLLSHPREKWPHVVHSVRETFERMRDQALAEIG